MQARDKRALTTSLGDIRVLLGNQYASIKILKMDPDGQKQFQQCNQGSLL